jgi:hypothetical protein
MFEQSCSTTGGMDFQTLFDSFSQCFGSTQTAYPPTSERDPSSRRSRSQTTSPRSSSKQHQTTHHNDVPPMSNAANNRNNNQDARKERYSKRATSRQYHHQETSLDNTEPQMITPPRPPPLSSKQQQERDGTTERQRSAGSSGFSRPKTTERPVESGLSSRKQTVPRTRTPKSATQPTRKKVSDSTPRKNNYVQTESPHVHSVAEAKNAGDATPSPSHARRSSESMKRTKSVRSTSKSKPATKDDIFRLNNRSKSTGTPFSQTKDVMKNALCMQVQEETNTEDQTPLSPVANGPEEFDRVPSVDTTELSLPASMFFERTASQLQKEELMPLYNQFSVPVDNSQDDGLNEIIATRSEPRAFDGKKPEQNYCKQIFVAAGGHDYFPDETTTRDGGLKSKGLTPQRKRTESTMSLSNASGMSSSTPNSAGGISFVPHSSED